MRRVGLALTLIVGLCGGVGSAWAAEPAEQPGPPASIVVGGFPATQELQEFYDVWVAVYDAEGRLRDGTLVSLSTSDPLAQVPPPRVVTRDAPQMSALHWGTAGPQTITATVVDDPSVTDTRAVTVVSNDPVPAGGGGGPVVISPPPAEPPTPQPLQAPSLAPVTVTPPAQAALACSRIPTLTGLRFDAAKRVLRDDGCRAITVKRTGKLRQKGRPTRVRVQSPLPGTPLAQGAVVTLRLGR